MNSVRRRALLIVLFAVATIVPGAGNAAMHLRLTGSLPESDAHLAESPAEIRLNFSQAPELAISRITLSGPDGAIALGDVRAVEGEDALVAAVSSPLGAGSYEVSWRTSSGDGHPIRGTFAFRVGATR